MIFVRIIPRGSWGVKCPNRDQTLEIICTEINGQMAARRVAGIESSRQEQNAALLPRPAWPNISLGGNQSIVNGSPYRKLAGEVNKTPLLGGDIAICLNVDVLRGFQGIDVVLRVLDGETLDEAVLMLDGTTFLASLVLGLFELLRRGVLLQSDVVKRHVV